MDAGGNLIESEQYDAFGSGAASTLSRYGYTGREWDADIGLYYYRARWYDPQAGRFISEDPIGFKGGINFYAYVKNSPIGFTDPLGLDPVEAIIWYPTDNEVNGLGGHVTYNIDGWMYSWEGHGPAPIRRAPGYIEENQKYRSGRGYLLDFGSDEANDNFANAIKRAYDGHRPVIGFPYLTSPYNLFTNNCGDALSRAVWQNGYGWDPHIAPLGHEYYINHHLGQYVKQINYYPKMQPGRGPLDRFLGWASDLGRRIANGIYGANYY